MRGRIKLLDVARARREEIVSHSGEWFKIPPLEIRCSICGQVLGITVRPPVGIWDGPNVLYGDHHQHRYLVPSTWMREQIGRAIEGGHTSINLPGRFLAIDGSNG